MARRSEPAEPTDRGQAAVELAAIIPLVMVVLLVSFEMIAALVTLERVENASRTGARVASMHGATAGQAAAVEAMPGWVNDHDVRVGPGGTGGVACGVEAQVPLLWPGVPVDFEVTRRVEMPAG